jgi:hypothetical protein
LSRGLSIIAFGDSFWITQPESLPWQQSFAELQLPAAIPSAIREINVAMTMDLTKVASFLHILSAIPDDLALSPAATTTATSISPRNRKEYAHVCCNHVVYSLHMRQIVGMLIYLPAVLVMSSLSLRRKCLFATFNEIHVRAQRMYY